MSRSAFTTTLRTLYRLGAYLAFGALGHLIMIGPAFDFTSPATWFYLIAWPALLLFYIVLLFLGLALVSVVIWMWVGLLI